LGGGVNDKQAYLWVVDTALGQLVRVDPKTGAKKEEGGRAAKILAR
jgi:hypothetical protein